MKNQHFDACYVIGLPRMGRLAAFLQSVPDDWGIPRPQIVHAIDAHRVPIPAWWTDIPALYACGESHRMVIAQALSAGHEQILIFEDDCRFAPNSAAAFHQFVEQTPDDWEGIMLGGQVSVHDGHTTPVTDRVSKCVQVERLHAYGLNWNGMRKFYDILSQPNSVANDYRWGDAQESGALTVYRCEPFIAYQADGRSSISGRIEATRIWDERVDVRLRDPDDIPIISLVCPFEVMERLRDAGLISNGGESPPFMAQLAPGTTERAENNVARVMLNVSEDDPARFEMAVRQLRFDTSFHRNSVLALWHPKEVIAFAGAGVVAANTYEEAAQKVELLKEPVCV